MVFVSHEDKDLSVRAIIFPFEVVGNIFQKMGYLHVTILVVLVSITLSQDYDYGQYAPSEQEYDRYPSPEQDYGNFHQPHPDYDPYPGPHPDYDRYPGPQPDYDRFPGPQPDYDHDAQLQPDGNNYAQQQPDYDIPAIYPYPPHCALECDCPIDFPSAMYCDGRNLHFIPVVPSGINYLYLQNNMIQDIKANVFDNATDLLWLILDHNHIRSENIDKGAFDKLVHLQKLSINYNNLTEPVGPLAKSLNELRLIGNKLSKFPSQTLVGLENLTALYLQSNELTSEAIVGAFNGLTSLVYLDISNNNLKQLPLGLPSSIEVLYADQNYIDSVPSDYLQNHPVLQYLRVSHNQLTDAGIPVGVFNMSSLLELDLSFNNLQSIPVVNENLENLYLQVNNINKFNIASFCRFSGDSSRLTHLRLDGNNIARRDLPLESPMCLRQVTMFLID
ncbi:lumican-like [Arapaima gigas]